MHSAVLATSLARMLRPWVTAVAYAAYATFVSPLSAAASIVGKLETSEALLETAALISAASGAAGSAVLCRSPRRSLGDNTEAMQWPGNKWPAHLSACHGRVHPYLLKPTF